jgi:hypothetical protein
MARRSLILVLFAGALVVLVSLDTARARAEVETGAASEAAVGTVATQCANGIDDGDREVDGADPGCSSASDETEAPDPAEPTRSGSEAEAEPAEEGGGTRASEALAGAEVAAAGNQPVVRNDSLGGAKRTGDGAITAPSAAAEPDAGGEDDASGGTSSGEAEAGSAVEAGSVSTSTSLLSGASESSVEAAEIPVLLIPVYEACGSQYDIPWQVLAAINKVETNFGTYLGDSSAGAEGWMQFLPSSWSSWGIDANGDGSKDPDDPVDAICAAARYLQVSGGASHIYRAVYAYNHADWYVREVLAIARGYEALPENQIASLTSLAEASIFPVETDAGASTEAASGTRARVEAAAGTPVVAVAAATVRKVGRSDARGRYAVVEDAYGDRFLYANLGARAGGERELRRGTRLPAGATFAKVGSGGYISFSVKPSGSDWIDAAKMLSVWKRGGVGKIFRVAAKHPLAADASPARVLLMSSGDLKRRLLADRRLKLAACERRAVAAGRLDRRTMASLEYLTSEGFSLIVGGSACSARVGFTVDLTGARESGSVGARTESATKLLLSRVDSLQGGLATAAGTQAEDAVRLDFYPPQKATLVDGKAVAPVDAPVAVQRMIAAANQISDTPYVWGGGHGAWASSGYDCSGSVSYVLHAAKTLSAPLTSGALAGWGSSGSGRWVTVYANATHTYAVIAGLRWDTVGDASGTGPRWHDAAAYPEGFAVRHPQGL